MTASSSAPRKASPLRRIATALGPGVVTGAADDDPSGITTYSITGAQFGTRFFWTAPVLWPLMAAVQMMCARIGMVTGRGLAGALRQEYPRWLIAVAAGALFVANYWTAVFNGLLAPFLMVGILHAASDRKLMRGQPSSWLGRAVVAFATVAMFVAGVAMFVT